MILRGDIHEPAVSTCIVSGVEVTRDLSLARVFVRLLEPTPSAIAQKRVVQALERANGFIRRTIAARLSIRRAPELRFAWDDAADRGRRVEELLSEIQGEGATPHASTDAARSGLERSSPGGARAGRKGER